MRIPVAVLVYPVRLSDYGWEYLILKRIESRGGFWQGVTGAIKSNEKIKQAAKRELLEETGYVPSLLIETRLFYKIQIKNEWKDRYPDGTKELQEYVFIARISARDPPKIDPSEHDDWKWCSFEEVMKLLLWDSNRTALGYIKNLLEEN